MPMSACCRPNNSLDRAAPPGFTLIELLIVLAVIGLAGALVGPPLARQYDQVSFALSREDVERSLSRLGRQAAREARDITLESWPASEEARKNLPPAVALPEGWGLKAETPILFRMDGWCSGGQFAITTPRGEYKYMMVAPFCRPEPAA